MEKLKKIKGNKGITLIALVVTIVVLLILAGVSISMLTGENGIIKQAQESKTETRGGTVQEARDLWQSEKKASNNQENTKTVNNLVDELVEKGHLTENEKDQILGNEEKGIKATGKVTIGTRTIVFFEVEPYTIGDYVEYNLDYDGDSDISDDWRIFYKDDDNIYLIATDYVSVAGVTSAQQNSGGHILQLQIQEGVTNEDTAIQFLQNKTYWSGLFGNDIADYAVGATTIELFSKSWNAKYPNQKIYLSYTEKGINAGFENNPTSVGVGGKEDDLYYLTKGSTPYATLGMWLASKSGDKGYLIRTVENQLIGLLNNIDGSLVAIGSTYRFIGIRPVVCLKSNVKLVYGEGTIENPHKLEIR